MSESRRVQRVEKELRQLVADYFLKGHCRAEDVGMVSVERVVASKDLRGAKVFLSFLGTERSETEMVEEIQMEAPRVQAMVAKGLRMKFCPKLQFQVDPGKENRLRVERLLHEISEGEEAQEDVSEKDSQ